MAGNCLFRLIPGLNSDKCKKGQKNRRQGQSTSMVKPVGEKPPQAVSDSSSNLHSATARPDHHIRYEQDNTFQRCIYARDEDEDVDMAAGVFIDRFHKDLELQRTMSEARYHDYLARAI